MKHKLFFGFLIVFQTTFGQHNLHDLSIGSNYPFSMSKHDLAREFGFEIGYNYNRVFKNNFSLICGLQIDIYEKLNWRKYTSIDFYIPLLIGYSHKSFDFHIGVSFNSAHFLTFTKYSGLDTELRHGYVYTPFYFDLNARRTYGFGLNTGIDYRITNRILTFLDYKVIRLDDLYKETEHYYYGLITFGFKLRLSNTIIQDLKQ